MLSRSAGITIRNAAAAGVVVALFRCALASAQTDTAANAPPTDLDPHAPGANAAAPSAEPAPSSPPPNSQPPINPGAAPTDFPKALTPQQRLPENLQGWLRERNRRQFADRPPVAAAPTLAPAAPTSEDSAAIEGSKRRLQSFDEGNVTVLSNRHAPAPPLVQVRAAAAVGVPAPVPVVAEQDPEQPSVTETRSLRAAQPKAPRVAPDRGFGWPVFLVPVATISLALLWLRRRRMPG